MSEGDSQSGIDTGKPQLFIAGHMTPSMLLMDIKGHSVSRLRRGK